MPRMQNTYRNFYRTNMQTVTLCVYTDQLYCHCVFISTDNWLLFYMMPFVWFLFSSWVNETTKSINQSVKNRCHLFYECKQYTSIVEPWPQYNPC